MKQRGVSFLEMLIVVGILFITSAFVMPGILDWRSKRSLEADYFSLLSNIDFIKVRVTALNGTGLLICSSPTQLTYQISSTPQSTATTVSSNFANTVLEDPTAKSAAFNILSGQSTVVSTLCSEGRGIFTASGLTGIEGSEGGAIDIELNRGGNRTPYGAYRVLVNQTTGF